MNIIFRIDGGIGKNIAATAVCRAIKNQHPKDKLIVLTGYPDVFLCNPHVDRIASGNDLLYFYRDYIDGKKVKMLVHDPFMDTGFISGDGHLIKVWCDMFGIEYNGELPELFLTHREQGFYAHRFASPKPIMLLQTHGGNVQQANKYSWMRDMPQATAQKIVYELGLDYNVVHLRRKDQPELWGCTPIQADLRAIAVLIQLSQKRLFINSFPQHMAAALGKPSVVCWLGNSPAQLGYDMHTNIVANPPTLKPELRHSVYSRYNSAAQVTEFPYNNEGEIFDAYRIIEALKNEEVEISGIGKAGNNARIKDKVTVEHRRGSMVANRLATIAGKIDLTDVKQVLDIGSRDLGQSVEFSAVFQNANIDAFEPVPDSYQLCLNRHASLSENLKGRIRAHNIALSNQAGEVPFYAVDPLLSSTPNIGASSMFPFMAGLNGTPFGQNLVQKEIKVKADTLDNWCTENNVSAVDIMWVDVQGAELLVFQGADNILKNTRIIMTEVGLKPYYEGHTLKADIDEYLFARGFRELEGAFELNGFDYEANTVYVKINEN